MKKTSFSLVYLCILICICFTKCKKNNDITPPTNTELNKLPAETQIGANTLGCLINPKSAIELKLN